MNIGKTTGIALASLCFLTAAQGCLRFSGGITSSTVPLPDNKPYTVIGDVYESDVRYGWLHTLFCGFPSAQVAIERAKNKHAADGLIDVTLENETGMILWIAVHIRGKSFRFTDDTSVSH